MASVIITRMRRYMITEVTLYVFFISFQALWLNARTRVNSLPCHERCRVRPYPMLAAREPFRRGLFAQAREGHLSGWRLHSAGHPSSFSRLTTLE